MTKNDDGRAASPWAFVPSMGLLQALTFAYVSILPGVFLKSIGAPNSIVGLAALFYLPVALRFLFGAFVDRYGSRRSWSLVCQLGQVAISLTSGVLAWCGTPVSWVLACFGAAALLGAFLDLSTDGFFLVATPSDRKAFFASLKVQAFRVGNAIAQGVYVMLVGALAQHLGGPRRGWGAVFVVHALVLLLLALWNFFAFPRPSADQPDRRPVPNALAWYRDVFLGFVRQPGMYWVFAYLAVYRIGESLLMAMKVPFLLDPPAQGGLGLSLQQVGFMNGVVAFLVLVVGGLVGGVAVERFGLARTMVPGVLIMNLPHLLFVYLAVQPNAWSVSLFGLEIPVVAQSFIALEALGYSLGFAPFIYIQILVARGPARATLFALVGGITNLGWTLPGAASGYLQERLGYAPYFVAITLLGLAVLALIPKIPATTLAANAAQDESPP